MISIILTIHNKEHLIKKIILGLIDTVSDSVKEYIFVIDGCTDNSLNIVKECLPLINVKTIIIETLNLYETKANNAGLRLATQPYVCIVQDDMLLIEKNWDKRLIKPMLEFDDIFAITARTSCRMDINGNWTDIIEGPVGQNYKKSTNISRDYIYINQVVNRGPLMFDNNKLKILGYFDENLPGVQGCDDCILCLKAYTEYKWRSGCYWIEYYSPLEWGSTRTGNNTSFVNKANILNEKEFLRRYNDIIKNWDAVEIRLLTDIE